MFEKSLLLGAVFFPELLDKQIVAYLVQTLLMAGYNSVR